MKAQEDKALYIKFKNREWIVWTTKKDGLMAIPGDEKPCSKDELFKLESYLYTEGFFPEYYAVEE